MGDFEPMKPVHGISVPGLASVLLVALAGCSSTFSDFSLPFVGKREVSPKPAVVATVPTRERRRETVDRGSLVVVEEGDTVYGLARAYGVPVETIRQANALAGADAIKVGDVLRIPVPDVPAPLGVASRTPTAVSGPGKSKSKGIRPKATQGPGEAVNSAPPLVSVSHSLPGRAGWRDAAPDAARQRASLHRVQPGESLRSIAAREKVSWAYFAMLNGLEPETPLRTGQVLVIPGREPPAVANESSRADGRIHGAVPMAPGVERGDSARGSVPLVLGDTTLITGSVAPDRTSANGNAIARSSGRTVLGRIEKRGFRWPVKGRVIRDFGVSPSGEFNDGLSIAVPEGTVIRAAEDGVVTYSGGQHLDYGNLVVIRHAGGWVTVYAHNRLLLVRPGEEVRRGQPVARAGRTGTVMVPQLHFKIRRHARPINPVTVLAEG